MPSEDPYDPSRGDPLYNRLMKMRNEMIDEITPKPQTTLPEGHRPYILPGKENIEYQYSDCPTRMITGAITGSIFGLMGGLFYVGWHVPEHIDRFSKVDAREIAKYTSSSAALTRPIFWCTLATVTYKGVSCLAEYVRDSGRETPWWNSAIGAAASGLVAGSIVRRFDVAAVSALVLGLTALGVKTDDAFRIDSRQAEPRIFKDSYKSDVNEESLKQQYPEYKEL